MKYSLSQSFRLKSPQAVSAVFMGGTSVRHGCLILHYRIIPALQTDAQPVRMAFAVPKRRFKKSVERNYIKRLMRECYRIQKLNMPNIFPEPMQMHAVLSYNHNEKPNYEMVMKDMTQILQKTVLKINAIHNI